MSDDSEQIRQWRRQAVECKAISAQMHLMTSRQRLERMAAHYDQLAENLEAPLPGRKERRPETS